MSKRSKLTYDDGMMIWRTRDAYWVQTTLRRRMGRSFYGRWHLRTSRRVSGRWRCSMGWHRGFWGAAGCCAGGGGAVAVRLGMAGPP